MQVGVRMPTRGPLPCNDGQVQRITAGSTLTGEVQALWLVAEPATGYRRTVVFSHNSGGSLCGDALAGYLQMPEATMPAQRLDSEVGHV